MLGTWRSGAVGWNEGKGQREKDTFSRSTRKRHLGEMAKSLEVKEGKRIDQEAKQAIRSNQERGRKAVLPPILEASEESSSDTEAGSSNTFSDRLQSSKDPFESSVQSSRMVGLDELEDPCSARSQVTLKDQQPSKPLSTLPQSSAHSAYEHSSC